MLNEFIPTELTSVWGFSLENIYLMTSFLKIQKAHYNLKENAKYFWKNILDVGTWSYTKKTPKYTV